MSAETKLTNAAWLTDADTVAVLDARCGAYCGGGGAQCADA